MDTLTIVIIILVLLWAAGYFVLSVGSLIHILLVVALVVLGIRLLRSAR